MARDLDPLPDPPTVPRIAFVRDGVVESDLRCLRCGYNLRGLSVDGRCPECGAGVRDATRGRSLYYADATWVRYLAGGVRLILWGVVVAALGVAAAVVVKQWIGPPGWLPILPAYGIVTLGQWRLAAPDPAGTDAASFERRWLRVAIVAVIALDAAYVSSTFFHTPPHLSRDLIASRFFITPFVWIVLMRRVHTLASRLRDPTLYGRSAAIVAGLKIGLFVHVPSIVVFLEDAVGLFSCCAVVTAPLFAGCLLATLSVLAALARALHQAADHASLHAE
jgi:hypothetical protein